MKKGLAIAVISALMIHGMAIPCGTFASGNINPYIYAEGFDSVASGYAPTGAKGDSNTVVIDNGDRNKALRLYASVSASTTNSPVKLPLTI